MATSNLQTSSTASAVLPPFRSDDNEKENPNKTFLSRPMSTNSLHPRLSSTSLTHLSSSMNPSSAAVSQRPVSVAAWSGETKTPTTSMSPARVLRYGETVESLFLIHDDSTEEYRHLCLQLIHDNDAAQDPRIWEKVLQLAVEQEERRQTSPDANLTRSHAVADLIRLHRRATTRLALTPESLPIWLSYARIQRHHKQDALMTLRHVSRVGMRSASFYLTKAELLEQWGDNEEAMKALEEGIEHDSQPIESIQAKLITVKAKISFCRQAPPDSFMAKAADKMLPFDTNDSGEADKENSNSNKRSYETHQCELLGAKKIMKRTPLASRQGIPSLPMSKTTTKVSTVMSSSKRPPLVCSSVSQRLGNSSLIKPQRLDPGLALADDTIMEESEDTTGRMENKAVKSKRAPKIDLSYIKAWDPDKSRCKAAPISQRIPSPATNDRPTGQQPAKTPGERNGSGTPPASSLRHKEKFDLSSIKKWQPEYHRRSSQEHVAMNEHLAATPQCPTSHVTQQSSTQRKPVVPRLDLSYMLEWDPSKRRPSMTTDTIKETELNQSGAPTLASTSGSVEIEKQNTTANAKTEIEATVTMRAGNEDQFDVERSTAEKVGKRRRSVPSNNEQSTSKGKGFVQDAYNIDFLSLARQDNMLNVNGISYMKLGVIGKGGSCKVYRALSKEGHVLAIKKVKISGMKKETMEGYANEIALLKRLRGSPVIIQMLDSQIDLTQKAILLVMEAGEADLSHVLHQQSLFSAAASRDSTHPRLDMNFVRLTWQQMLKAVHCIHEERIVHGDLKPANFLFVRGALKLIDFGIAKAIQSDDTTNIYRDSQIGTVNYMSPESLINVTGDKQYKMGRASDIWSLGCILYQMIYGKTPFAELHLMQKLQAIANPNHKISFPASVEESAIDCMKQCLRYKAEERPPIVGSNGLLNDHPFLNAKR